MVVTGVTAMQPLMSPGHLAACREPWVMTKVCTPPAHLLSAFSVGARAPAGFCMQTHQTWPRTLPCGTGVFVAGCRSKPSSSAPAPRPRPPDFSGSHLHWGEARNPTRGCNPYLELIRRKKEK